MADVDTKDEWGFHAAENLPNHSTSLRGLGRFVRIIDANPTLRTRQAAYRLAAHLLVKAQTLPNEENASTWDDVLDAVTEEFGTILDEEEDDE